MNRSVNLEDIQSAIDRVKGAAQTGKLSTQSQARIIRWLTEAGCEDGQLELIEHIHQGKWDILEDLFYTVIPFGTGGRRGRMYPFGTNAINNRTIGESAQGLADYVRKTVPKSQHSCAIAYDTRHRSREFAQLCAEVMAAAGFQVYFLDGYRSTPELSFTIRHFGCDCGIMVTASHNPPSDNAVKVYWSNGGQLVPPHDAAVIDAVQNVREIGRVPFDEALSRGQISFVQEEADRAFVDAVLRQSLPGPRQMRIVYSPLHGVGTTAVLPVLSAAGFQDVHLFPDHAEPSGDFPNVPGNIANPEVPEVFERIFPFADRVGADIVLATDPDCDRVGCAVRESLQPDSRWQLLTGNQTGVLLTAELIRRQIQGNRQLADCYVVKTMVTTELITAICQAHGVQVAGDLPVGFRWIAAEMEKRSTEGFLLGAEESYGFLIGDHARDKDAAVASLVLCELAAFLKSQGKTLYQYLIELFQQYGWHRERTFSVNLPGAKGMLLMEQLMSSLREQPPAMIGPFSVSQVRDYRRGLRLLPDGRSEELSGPKTDTLFFDFTAKGNCVAVRPSGTEPKIKFYLFGCEPPGSYSDPDTARKDLENRLDALERAIREEINRRTGIPC
jgi:phosphomannomutase